jgi:general secretion pathway protein D
LKKSLAAALLTFLLCGCAAQLAFREGNSLVEAGDVDAGLAKLEQAAKLDPTRSEYRIVLVRQREQAVQRLLVQGDTAKQQGDNTLALAAYRRAASLDPQNARAKLALQGYDRDERHQKLIEEAEAALKTGRTAEAQTRVRIVLAENRDNRAAQALQRRLDQAAPPPREPTVSTALQRPITLEFRDADLKTIFELISRSTGMNFFFDKDVRPDLRTTVFVRNTSIEDVIRFILVTNQLERKILNENTLLIYPNTAAKIKEYQDLITKTFYLAHADVKQTANLLRALVKTRDLFLDEKLRMIVIRDTPDAVRMAEKLVASHDIAESEVMLEVEVLEVSSNLLTDLGIRFPDQVSVSVVGAAGTAGTLTLPEIQNRSSSLYRVSVTNPLLIANLKDQLGRTNTLANPRIRVKDGQKARVHIGDRVPVITTTLTATSFVSESVSYLDVGLKLEVEPTISLSNEVSIKMALEVSNIVQEIRSGSGTLTYQLGTRNAATVLHLRDGETQILAGLISDDERKSAERIPGLGRLPLLGRLFGTERATNTKTEIVLLITPRIVRTLARPEGQFTEFMSGTESAVGAAPLVLRSADASQPAAATGGVPGAGAVAPASSAPVGGSAAPAPAVAATPAAPRPPFAPAGPAVTAPTPPPFAPPGAGAAAPTPGFAASAPPSGSAAATPIAAATPGGAGPFAPGAASATQLAALNVQAPKQAKGGEEFAVTIDVAAEGALRAGSFDLAFDQSRLRVVRVEEGAALKQAKGSSFNSNVQEKEGRVSVSYAAPETLKAAQTLARVVFQVNNPNPGTTLITMSNVSGVDTSGKPVPVAAPVPATLTITR